MRRIACPPRADWRARVEALGFDFHSLDGAYWVDDACYRFDSRQIDRIEAATGELHQLCLEAAAHVVERGDYAQLGLDAAAATLIERSWRAREPAVYGRFDLAYDGYGEPKLLEYNADTPTSLFEAAVVQWYWLEDTRVGSDQFNLIHERLVERWPQVLPAHATVHFAGCLEAPEDRVTVDYLRDTCAQAGFATRLLDIADIGWHAQRYVDLDERPIEQLFKLYPWEWMLQEAFAEHLPSAPTRWIEPAWKQLLSNKSLLPLLWRLFPGHPNLLPASHDPGDIDGAVVAKPRFGREGEDVRIFERGQALGTGETVYQAYAPLYSGIGGHAVLGAWVVGDRAAGLGVREDDGPVTRNTSRFVPHCFD
ncbi:glutathionylspermidine synthase family protein [Lysobacter silvisoli]|uniref:Glutathionylspermidine synthase family protein n=1 Tax=Lysobacter silvisoli TaxID=2293254 RepID=A0A371JWV4_9GAMM|nr:glutathionylspermidine synthase family protein [Lysobacter silvisoli]RDZ26128.1 glutathionylspermidine synthase family protein [Lysobacter silvisoli]